MATKLPVLPKAVEFYNLSIEEMDKLVAEVMSIPVKDLPSLNEKKLLIKELRGVMMDASRLEVGGKVTPPQALNVVQVLAQSRGDDLKYFEGIKALADTAFKSMEPVDWNLGSKLYWTQTKAKFLNFVSDAMIQGTEPYIHTPWRSESGPTGQTSREPWNNLAVVAKIHKILISEGVTPNWEASPRKKSTANRSAAEALAEEWLYSHVGKVFPTHVAVQRPTWGSRTAGLGGSAPGFKPRETGAVMTEESVSRIIREAIHGKPPEVKAPEAPAPTPVPVVVPPVQPVFSLKASIAMLKAEGISLPDAEVVSEWESNEDVTNYVMSVLKGQPLTMEVLTLLRKLG